MCMKGIPSWRLVLDLGEFSMNRVVQIYQFKTLYLPILTKDASSRV